MRIAIRPDPGRGELDVDRARETIEPGGGEGRERSEVDTSPQGSPQIVAPALARELERSHVAPKPGRAERDWSLPRLGQEVDLAVGVQLDRVALPSPGRRRHHQRQLGEPTFRLGRPAGGHARDHPPGQHAGRGDSAGELRQERIEAQLDELERGVAGQARRLRLQHAVGLDPLEQPPVGADRAVRPGRDRHHAASHRTPLERHRIERQLAGDRGRGGATRQVELAGDPARDRQSRLGEAGQAVERKVADDDAEPEPPRRRHPPGGHEAAPLGSSQANAVEEHDVVGEPKLEAGRQLEALAEHGQAGARHERQLHREVAERSADVGAEARAAPDERLPEQALDGESPGAHVEIDDGRGEPARLPRVANRDAPVRAQPAAEELEGDAGQSDDPGGVAGARQIDRPTGRPRWARSAPRARPDAHEPRCAHRRRSRQQQREPVQRRGSVEIEAPPDGSVQRPARERQQGERQERARPKTGEGRPARDVPAVEGGIARHAPERRGRERDVGV